MQMECNEQPEQLVLASAPDGGGLVVAERVLYMGGFAVVEAGGAFADS